MILADTSVWTEHLRNGQELLRGMIAADEVQAHPLVIGELACGRLPNRARTLAQLGRLPQCAAVSDAEVLLFLERRRLAGSGLSYIDVHLLATAAITDTQLWAFDQKLRAEALALGLAADAFLEELEIPPRAAHPL